MKELTYKDLKEIAYATAISDEYPPSVIPSRYGVINNVKYYVTLYMEGPEDPYIELLAECSEKPVGGYLHEFKDPFVRDHLRDMLQDDVTWVLTNYEQVYSNLLDASKRGAAIAEALELLEGPVHPDEVVADFLKHLMAKYEKCEKRILNG